MVLYPKLLNSTLDNLLYIIFCLLVLFYPATADELSEENETAAERPPDTPRGCRVPLETKGWGGLPNDGRATDEPTNVTVDADSFTIR